MFELKKYKPFIMYLLFGCLTTIINLGSYYVVYNKMGINNVLSTIYAWCVAVLFAFFTNKIFVFKSETFEHDVFFRELVSFFACRLLTGGIDLAIMYISVDVFSLNEMVWKLVANIIVIIINFVVSKIFIFKSKFCNTTELPEQKI